MRPLSLFRKFLRWRSDVHHDRDGEASNSHHVPLHNVPLVDPNVILPSSRVRNPFRRRARARQLRADAQPECFFTTWSDNAGLHLNLDVTIPPQYNGRVTRDGRSVSLTGRFVEPPSNGSHSGATDSTRPVISRPVRFASMPASLPNQPSMPNRRTIPSFAPLPSSPPTTPPHGRAETPVDIEDLIVTTAVSPSALLQANAAANNNSSSPGDSPDRIYHQTSASQETLPADDVPIRRPNIPNVIFPDSSMLDAMESQRERHIHNHNAVSRLSPADYANPLLHPPNSLALHADTMNRSEMANYRHATTEINPSEQTNTQSTTHQMQTPLENVLYPSREQHNANEPDDFRNDTSHAPQYEQNASYNDSNSFHGGLTCPRAPSALRRPVSLPSDDERSIRQPQPGYIIPDHQQLLRALDREGGLNAHGRGSQVVHDTDERLGDHNAHDIAAGPLSHSFNQNPHIRSALPHNEHINMTIPANSSGNRNLVLPSGMILETLQEMTENAVEPISHSTNVDFAVTAHGSSLLDNAAAQNTPHQPMQGTTTATLMGAQDLSGPTSALNPPNSAIASASSSQPPPRHLVPVPRDLEYSYDSASHNLRVHSVCSIVEAINLLRKFQHTPLSLLTVTIVDSPSNETSSTVIPLRVSELHVVSAVDLAPLFRVIDFVDLQCLDIQMVDDSVKLSRVLLPDAKWRQIQTLKLRCDMSGSDALDIINCCHDLRILHWVWLNDAAGHSDERLWRIGLSQRPRGLKNIFFFPSFPTQVEVSIFLENLCYHQIERVTIGCIPPLISVRPPSTNEIHVRYPLPITDLARILNSFPNLLHASFYLTSLSSREPADIVHHRLQDLTFTSSANHIANFSAFLRHLNLPSLKQLELSSYEGNFNLNLQGRALETIR